MKWQKSSQEFIDFFERIAPEGPGVEKRKMFGYPCRFLNGNMFFGIFQDMMFLRLSEPDRKTFLQLEQASRFEPMPGRIMKEYVVVPSYLIKNQAKLQDWITKSLDYVSQLPLKVKNTK